MAIKANPNAVDPSLARINLAAEARAFDKLMVLDPELGRMMKRNAVAARNLAMLREDDLAYGEWLKEYWLAGDELRALYGRRPALLGPQARHE